MSGTVAQKPKKKVNARSLARERTLQALYQWQNTGQDIRVIEGQFLEIEIDSEHKPLREGVDLEYFKMLLHGIPQEITELDQLIKPFLDRPLEQVDLIEKIALWIGCYELKCCPTLPYRVAINESVELAKSFGADKSYQYVNGVLDKVCRALPNRI